jgi:hypothetical protein
MSAFNPAIPIARAPLRSGVYQYETYPHTRKLLNAWRTLAVNDAQRAEVAGWEAAFAAEDRASIDAVQLINESMGRDI